MEPVEEVVVHPLPVVAPPVKPPSTPLEADTAISEISYDLFAARNAMYWRIQTKGVEQKVNLMCNYKLPQNPACFQDGADVFVQEREIAATMKNARTVEKDCLTLRKTVTFLETLRLGRFVKIYEVLTRRLNTLRETVNSKELVSGKVGLIELGLETLVSQTIVDENLAANRFLDPALELIRMYKMSVRHLQSQVEQLPDDQQEAPPPQAEGAEDVAAFKEIHTKKGLSNALAKLLKDANDCMTQMKELIPAPLCIKTWEPQNLTIEQKQKVLAELNRYTTQVPEYSFWKYFNFLSPTYLAYKAGMTLDPAPALGVRIEEEVGNKIAGLFATLQRLPAMIFDGNIEIDALTADLELYGHCIGRLQIRLDAFQEEISTLIVDDFTATLYSYAGGCDLVLSEMRLWHSLLLELAKPYSCTVLKMSRVLDRYLAPESAESSKPTVKSFERTVALYTASTEVKALKAANNEDHYISEVVTRVARRSNNEPPTDSFRLTDDEDRMWNRAIVGETQDALTYQHTSKDLKQINSDSKVQRGGPQALLFVKKGEAKDSVELVVYVATRDATDKVVSDSSSLYLLPRPSPCVVLKVQATVKRPIEKVGPFKSFKEVMELLGSSANVQVQLEAREEYFQDIYVAESVARIDASCRKVFDRQASRTVELTRDEEGIWEQVIRGESIDSLYSKREDKNLLPMRLQSVIIKGATRALFLMKNESVDSATELLYYILKKDERFATTYAIPGDFRDIITAYNHEYSTWRRDALIYDALQVLSPIMKAEQEAVDVYTLTELYQSCLAFKNKLVKDEGAGTRKVEDRRNSLAILLFTRLNMLAGKLKFPCIYDKFYLQNVDFWNTRDGIGDGYTLMMELNTAMYSEEKLIPTISFEERRVKLFESFLLRILTACLRSTDAQEVACAHSHLKNVLEGPLYDDLHANLDPSILDLLFENTTRKLLGGSLVVSAQAVKAFANKSSKMVDHPLTHLALFVEQNKEMGKEPAVYPNELAMFINDPVKQIMEDTSVPFSYNRVHHALYNLILLEGARPPAEQLLTKAFKAAKNPHVFEGWCNAYLAFVVSMSAHRALFDKIIPESDFYGIDRRPDEDLWRRLVSKIGKTNADNLITAVKRNKAFTERLVK